MNISTMMGLKGAWSTFKRNHPKVPKFFDQVKTKGFEKDQEIANAIRYPDGTEYKTGIRVTESDLQLLNKLK